MPVILEPADFGGWIVGRGDRTSSPLRSSKKSCNWRRSHQT